MAAQIPDPYSAESMGLEPGDRIVYRGRDVFQVGDEGTVRVLWPGLEGRCEVGAPLRAERRINDRRPRPSLAGQRARGKRAERYRACLKKRKPRALKR